jgi:tetratricopeptide (TPR) repeat protein
MVKSHYEFDFPGAEKEFLKAIELNPNSAYAHLFYGNCYLLPVGRTQDAIAENRKALELDPLSLPINNFMGITYAYAGDYEKSYEQFRHTIEMDPTFPLAHLYLSGVLQFMGRYKESIQEFEKSRLLSGSDPDAAGREAADMLQAFNEAGEKGFWQHTLERMLQLPQGIQQQSDFAGNIAVAYAMAGDKDNAFEWLNKAYEEREGGTITLLKCDPYFEKLRGDPRYLALLHKLGLAE